MYIQEILIKVLKEQNWEDDLQILMQSHCINEFDVPLLKPQLFRLPEMAKFYGLDSRIMWLSEMIALFQKLADLFQKLANMLI